MGKRMEALEHSAVLTYCIYINSLYFSGSPSPVCLPSLSNINLLDTLKYLSNIEISPGQPYGSERVLVY